MFFQSFEFLFFFLPVVLVLSYIACSVATYTQQTKPIISVASSRVNKFILLTASFVFYGYWNYKFIPLLGLSIIVNYMAYRFIIRHPFSLIVTLTITFNLLILAFFKYTNFFLDNISFFFPDVTVKADIILPLGISFFTFQQVAFLADIRREGFKPRFNYSLMDYALYISFFPQLVAGPIVRHYEFMPQISQMMKFTKDRLNNFYIALILFSIGVIKKVFIADKLAAIANPVFKQALVSKPSFIDGVSAAFAFSFQIYFDFSAYSDMAIALGLLFCIKLPVNFNSPYRATSIKDFWRRWHITLSSFLRDYVYIPLGGNRNGDIGQYKSIIITMVIGGVWHGASWLFVLWGLLNGIALAFNHWFIKHKIRVIKPIGFVATMLFIVITFTIFRSTSLEQLGNLLSGIFLTEELGVLSLSNLFFLLFGFMIVISPFNSQYFISKTSFLMTPNKVSFIAISFLLSFAIFLVFAQSNQSFIYFEF